MRSFAHVLTTSATFAALVSGAITPVKAQDLSPAELARLKSEYRRPPPRPTENAELVELGRDLFFEPQLSASGKTSCAACHFPELGWGVKDARSTNDSGKLTARKSQPLIGIGYMGAAPVGWDGRNANLEAQAKSSISTGSMSMRETPTPIKVELIEERIRSDAGHVKKFAAAMPKAEINIDAIVKAIAAFERTLEPGVAPFDRWMEGDEQAMSDSAKRGFVLFNGKANCFACHSGWRLTDDKFHDIGTTTTDVGRGQVDKNDELMKFAFKTPTLRSVALRPPFMHNASAATLHDVMRHYEKGGIDRQSRSALLVPIALTDQEREDLVAFMEALTGVEGNTTPLR